MKASTKLYTLFSLQFLIALFLIISVLMLQSKQASDSVIINLAGRQRMLTQKLSKEILLLNLGLISPEKIKNTVAVFQETLKALRYGGKAPLDLERSRYTELPPPTDTDVIRQLGRVEKLWKEFSGKVNKFIEVVNSDRKMASECLLYIKENNIPLLKEMNKAVFLTDYDASRKVKFIRKSLIAGGVILSICFLISFWVIRKDIQKIFQILEK